MTSPDIHRETKQRMETVIDTPSFADQIKKRANDAYKSVFSTLHSMMVRFHGTWKESDTCQRVLVQRFC